MDFETQAGITQGIIFLSMAFGLPWSIRPTKWAKVRFALYSIFIWSAYTLVAMLVDVALGEGVPGIGYIFMRFLAWLIGNAFLITRLRRVAPLPDMKNT